MRILVKTIIIFFMLIPVVVISIMLSYPARKLECEYAPSDINPPPPIPQLMWKGTGLVTIWFDDAYVSQGSTEVVEAMDKNGFVGAISVATGSVCKVGIMSWAQLRRLQEKGWEITSHSVSHYCDISKYNAKTIPYELLQSKSELQARGLRATNFVIPCGYNEHVLPNVWHFAKQHYLSYRKAGEQINPLPLRDAYTLTSFSISYSTPDSDIRNWIHKAVKEKAWIILAFHQIDELKYNYHTDGDKFKKILGMIKTSGLHVVLPTQVLALNSPSQSIKIALQKSVSPINPKEKNSD